MGYFDDSEEGYTDQGRAGYEPRTYYRFRRAFRPCLGAFLIVLFGALFHLRAGGWWITRGQLIAMGAVVSVSFAVVVVVFVGMILTAPKAGKRRCGPTDSTDDDWWIGKRRGV